MKCPTSHCINNSKKNKLYFVSQLTGFFTSVSKVSNRSIADVFTSMSCTSPSKKDCPSSPKEVTSHLSFAKLIIYTTSLTKAMHSHWLEVLVWFGLKTLHFTMILDNHSYRKILILKYYFIHICSGNLQEHTDSYI